MPKKRTTKRLKAKKKPTQLASLTLEVKRLRELVEDHACRLNDIEAANVPVAAPPPDDPPPGS